MIRNSAGQSIGAQMLDASTGAAFVGAVTVYVTGDSGTQALGSVGAGVCASEGNGYFSYRPSQAETNYEHIAFTFIGAGAIPATIQVATISQAQAAAIGSIGTRTIANVLTDMTVVDNELDVSSGGADESRAIAAIGMAIVAFEGAIANVPDLLGTIGTLVTAANIEYTAWPSNLLRLDTLWLLDANGRQSRVIGITQDVGGHTASAFFPSSAANTTGAPRECYTNRAYLYWNPLPDAIHTIRAYGLYAKTRPAARTDIFEYPDLVSVPVAVYAVRLMEMGIDDPSDELKGLAEELFNPAIKALSRPTRQAPQTRHYTEVHST